MSTIANSVEPIQVGTRVHRILYGGSNGIVYAIHGEQRPETIRSIGGIVSTGGGAEFDIVFPTHISRRVPECVIHGVQWRILPGIATAEEIATAQQECAAHLQAEKEKAVEVADKFSKAVADLRVSPTYAKLTQVQKGDYGDYGKPAASNIRVELKTAFPKVKFTVRTDHGTIRVGWTDGPTVEAVKVVTSKYEGGSFDGMEDLYTHKDTPFKVVFGSAKYIFENRSYSEETVKAAVAFINKRYGWSLSPEKYSLGHLAHNESREIHNYLERRFDYKDEK